MTYTYINEDEIDVELKCSICDEPFRSPVNCTNCGHTFCQICILTWTQRQSSCPTCRQSGNRFIPVITRVVLNQLNRLLVQCKLCQQTNIQRSNYNDHISQTCPKQIIPCIDNCGWSGARENLPEHLLKCPKQIILCIDNCGWKGLREDLQEHLIKCRQKTILGIEISQWRMMIACLILAYVFYFILLK